MDEWNKIIGKCIKEVRESPGVFDDILITFKDGTRAVLWASYDVQREDAVVRCEYREGDNR